MSKYLYKLTYILRKKVEGALLRYKVNEVRALFGHRVHLPRKLHIERFPDLYFDDSDSALHLGENIAVRGAIQLLFHQNGQLTIGEGTFFNNGCSVNCMERVVIGKNCLFGENVRIYDHDHRFREKDLPIKDQGFSTRSVEIGENCWFGSNVVVLKGVKIGDDCVIGAGCTIHKDVPAGSLVFADAGRQIIKPIHDIQKQDIKGYSALL